MGSDEVLEKTAQKEFNIAFVGLQLLFFSKKRNCPFLPSGFLSRLVVLPAHTYDRLSSSRRSWPEARQ